jgi:hypothetical protein
LVSLKKTGNESCCIIYFSDYHILLPGKYISLFRVKLPICKIFLYILTFGENIKLMLEAKRKLRRKLNGFEALRQTEVYFGKILKLGRKLRKI